MVSKKKRCSACDTDQYIWKNVTEEDGVRKKYCKTCYSKVKPTTMPKRTPLPKQTTRIAPRSDKRAKQEVAYSILRKSFLERNPVCQMQIPGVCTGSATTIHHEKGRIGDLLLDEKFWRSGCMSCHEWIEKNVTAAKELGLSVSRLENDGLDR